jgi:hypothetical protein
MLRAGDFQKPPERPWGFYLLNRKTGARVSQGLVEPSSARERNLLGARTKPFDAETLVAEYSRCSPPPGAWWNGGARSALAF